MMFFPSTPTHFIYYIAILVDILHIFIAKVNYTFIQFNACAFRADSANFTADYKYCKFSTLKFHLEMINPSHMYCIIWCLNAQQEEAFWNKLINLWPQKDTYCFPNYARNCWYFAHLRLSARNTIPFMYVCMCFKNLILWYKIFVG